MESLYTAEMLHQLDELAISKQNTEAFTLMERAGISAYQVMLERFPNINHIALFTGSGNNAGDGYIFASLAANDGIRVDIIQVGETNRFSPAANKALEQCQHTNIQFKEFTEDRQYDLVIDALLGIGYAGELSDKYKHAINCINQINLPVLAIDVPSGLMANTGHVPEVAVKADYTITYIGRKQGLYTGQAIDYIGDVILNDLGVEQSIFDLVKSKVWLADEDVTLLSGLSQARHKGDCGRVLVIGGNEGMAGAALLSAKAALRVGAGLVQVATDPIYANQVALSCPELLSCDVTHQQSFESALNAADIVLIGPGLGQTLQAKKSLYQSLASNKPLLLDADALNIIAEEGLVVPHENMLMTPHPGEAARLLSVSICEIQKDRFEAVKQLKKKFNIPVVLKGWGSLIGMNDEQIIINPYGCGGMATAGMGDILAGVVTGLWAGGIPNDVALLKGVVLHGIAGQIAGENEGERGLIASDLLPVLRNLVG